MVKKTGSLFLLPSPIHENGIDSISPEVIRIIHSLDYFIVEKARTARRYVSATGHPKKIETLVFEEIPMEEISDGEIEILLQKAMGGENIGLMSEAGLPAVADPGSRFVSVAQKAGIKVVPLAGPSSIMMALMGSGLEGQRFSFHGYLSAKKSELPAQLRKLDQRADLDDATQIWIEAPYRNRQIMESIEGNISANRMLCIAANMGNEDGFVLTKQVSLWKKSGWPEIHKMPAVFLIR